MATSKTLTPTNVTIQIPDFTDQPDQRVNSNCIDKEADAINALNGKITSSNITLTNTQSINTYVFKKKDDIRSLYMELIGWDTSSETVVGVIPSDSRPSARKMIMQQASDTNVSSANGIIIVTIETNGNIKVKSIGVTGSHFVAFSIEWFV